MGSITRKEILREEKTAEIFNLTPESSLESRKTYPIVNTVAYETQEDFDLGYKTADGKKLKLLDDGVGFKSATENKVQKYNGSKLADSSITDDGETVGVSVDLEVTGTIKSASLESVLGGNLKADSEGNISVGDLLGTFTDDLFRVTDQADTTKKIALELSGVTTGTTRTLTVPNSSGTIALQSAFSGTGAYTNFTIVNGIITAAS